MQGMRTRERKAKYKARQGAVYDALCDRILLGKYPAGSALRELTVAREFSVSRTPVREVFRMLAADGLIRLVPNHGAVVEGFTPDDIEDIYDIRRGLESLAIECACSRIPLAVLRDFKRQFRAMRKSTNARQHAELDQAFHRALHQYAGRRRLSALLEREDRLMQHFRHLGFHPPSQIQNAADEHLAIIDALLIRDTARAIQAMNTHLLNSKRVVLSMLT